MKYSIALYNSAIALKAGNGKNGYNFYQWLRDAQKRARPDLTLKELFVAICFAAMTEKSCKSYFSTSN